MICLSALLSTNGPEPNALDSEGTLAAQSESETVAQAVSGLAQRQAGGSIGGAVQVLETGQLPQRTRSDGTSQTVGRSIFWLLAQSTASRVLQSLTQVVLAWWLLPSDFGTIGIALTVSALVNALFQFGLDDVLLRRRHAMRMWLGTAFWISLILGCLNALALLLVAPLSARVYQQPHLAALITVMALAAPLGALSFVPQTVLRAQLRFRALSLVTFAEAIGTTVLAITFAVAGAGVYSFVLPIPVMSLCRTAIVWQAARPPNGRISRKTRWRKLLPSATAVLGSRVLGQFVGQGDYIVFGLTATATQVGLYYFAFRIAGQPMRLLAGSLTGVLFPALTQFKENPARQCRAVISSSKALALIVMPVCFAQAAVAEPALALFFDPKWAGAAFFIRILSIALAFDAVSWTVGALLPARGEFKTAFVCSVVMAAVFLTFIVIGALINESYGVPLAVSSYYILCQPAYCFYILRRSGQVSLRTFVEIYAAPAMASSLAATCAILSVHSMTSPAAKLVLLPAMTLTLYAIAIWYMSPEASRHLLQRLKELVRSKRSLEPTHRTAASGITRLWRGA